MKPMRTLLSALALFTTAAFAQPDPKTMDNYVFTLIWAKPDAKELTKEENQKLMVGHMAHIESMAKEGSLVAAGPANSPGSRLRGIFVFRAPMEKAKELANADPTVKGGVFELDSHTWYSYKGIGEPYKTWRAANPDGKVKMATYQLAIFKKGPRGDATPADLQKYAQEHLAGIAEGRKAGKIVCAGPVQDSSKIAGIGVFATSLDEAKAILEKDAFVSRGIMTVEWYSWFAAADTFPPAQ